MWLTQRHLPKQFLFVSHTNISRLSFKDLSALYLKESLSYIYQEITNVKSIFFLDLSALYLKESLSYIYQEITNVKSIFFLHELNIVVLDRIINFLGNIFFYPQGVQTKNVTCLL
jgi:3-methyladenine DNA glycosylase AlkC